ncbi:MAG: DNA-3-methyladenine glycosylase [Rhodopirellula sp.]|mgnify:CR=1 FL=1|nr:DNA-3-methyladenine glycosylase [Rhodopirellula sp.]
MKSANHWNVAEAIDHVSMSDPIMASVIQAVGPYGLKTDSSPFRMLVRSITGQQLSVKAAATIWGRLVNLNGSSRISPASLNRLSDRDLRAAGVSHAKIRSIRDITDAFASRRITASHLKTLNDDSVKSELIKLHGVGPWTADMFLMFALGRPDVFPIGDLGIIQALQAFYPKRNTPNGQYFQRLAERWRPYRTLASWYCWQGLKLVRTTDWKPART